MTPGTRIRSLAEALALLAAPVLLAAPAHASEGGGGDGHALAELLWQTGNLLLLLGVLVYFGRKPLQSFFETRRSRIQDDLAESARLLEAAETRYADWQRKLIELEGEIEKIRSDGVRHAEDEAARILSDAQAAAARIQRDAESAVEQELRRAKTSLRAEAVALATQMAEGILREELADSDRERLLDEFIVSVEPSSRGGAN